MARRDFSGKVILITGAAGGLGAALCHRFAAAGAHIAAMDLDATRLQDLVATLPAGTLSIAGNIADPAACQAAIDQTVAHFGALDGLINNAGISHRSLFQDTDPAVIRRVMEVNFFGAMQMTHAALPHLIQTRGMVTAISSVAGYAPLLGRTGYAASKHALHGFFDTLRTEVEALGVGVTLVCPSFIATGIGRAALSGQGGSATSARITAGGESSPDDIAQRIVDALAQGRSLLLPDRTSRLAWWVHKFAPGFYARTMKRRVGAEFPTPSEETRS
jgi:NAD(P)-dependent dehydrogenase (short-subunit alcohol dehydrogenase family)